LYKEEETWFVEVYRWGFTPNEYSTFTGWMARNVPRGPDWLLAKEK
jgi:hypothetical protein